MQFSLADVAVAEGDIKTGVLREFGTELDVTTSGGFSTADVWNGGFSVADVWRTASWLEA